MPMPRGECAMCTATATHLESGPTTIPPTEVVMPDGSTGEQWVHDVPFCDVHHLMTDLVPAMMDGNTGSMN